MGLFEQIPFGTCTKNRHETAQQKTSKSPCPDTADLIAAPSLKIKMKGRDIENDNK